MKSGIGTNNRAEQVATRLAASLGVLVGLCLSSAAVATPTNFSFTGTFAADDDVQLFSFTTDGSSVITLRTYSYAGGTQANGNIVPSGGFDPTQALFDSTGNLIADNDDGAGVPSDPITGESLDTELSSLLAAGSYTVAISQYDNFANGPNLSDGFARTGNPFFTAALTPLGCTNGQFCDVSENPLGNNRTNAWAFDVLNAETAVPEPSTGLLLGLGVAGISVVRRRK